MGKTIDRAILFIVITAAVYTAFIQISGSIPAAILLTLLCGLLLRRALRGRLPRKKLTTLEAQALLKQWAFAPDSEAVEAIASLMRIEKPEQLIYLSRSPAVALSISDVFNAWKAHSGEDKIILSAPCYADTRARTFARTLKAPCVELLDAAKLIPRIRASNLQPPRVPLGRAMLSRLQSILTELPGRRPWHRSALIGLGLLAFYWITANPVYLFLAIGMLFLAGVTLRLRRI